MDTGMEKRMLRLLAVVGSVLAISSLSPSQTREVIPSESTELIRSLESKHYVPYVGGPTFDEIVAKGGLKSHEINRVKSFPTAIVNRGTSTEKDVWLHILTANSDLVAIGRPRNRVSALIDTGTFVFSDYQFEIETVLRDRSHSLNTGQAIVVTRAGGAVRHGDWTYRGLDPEFHPFQGGERYLLFLLRLPETNTFLARASGTFLLKGGKVHAGAAHSANLPEGRDEDDLMRSVQQFSDRAGGT